MKMTKKILSVAAATAMVIGLLPVVPAQAAPNAIATYDFENGLAGLSDTGYGTAPEVVADAERGNVLQFHDGTASRYLSRQENPELEENSTDIEINTPSSLKLDTNPFAGKSLTSATITMWVKAPATAVSGCGLVGFVSDKKENVVHPDKTEQGKDDVAENISGYYAYGISTAGFDDVDYKGSMLYFGGFLRNTMWYQDYGMQFRNNADQWVHMVVTLGNEGGQNNVYINGVDVEGERGLGKRFNHGEENGGQAGNTTMPLMFEVLSEATTQAYLGYTGSSGTVEGVCIDDVCFYDSAVDAAGAMELYNAAKATAGGSAGNTNNGNGSDNAAGGDNASGGDNAASGDNAAGGNASGSNNASGSSNASGNKTSTAKTGSSSTSSKNAQNLPQTGVVSTGVLVAFGAAAVAGGAILFKKKENDQQ